MTSLSVRGAVTERMFVSHELMQDLGAAARCDVPVLISAPSAEGCEQFAGLIHRASWRAAGRFHQLACRSLTSASLEAVLFGTPSVPGLLAQADGGTVVLGQVDAASIDVQLRLVDFLESRDRTRRVRLITTTTRDLYAEVQRRRFLAGLFYRLNVIHIMVPGCAAARHRGVTVTA